MILYNKKGVLVKAGRTNLSVLNFIGDVGRVKRKVSNFSFPSRGAKKGVIPRPAVAGLRKKWAELAPRSIPFISSYVQTIDF